MKTVPRVGVFLVYLWEAVSSASSRSTVWIQPLACLPGVGVFGVELQGARRTCGF